MFPKRDSASSNLGFKSFKMGPVLSAALLAFSKGVPQAGPCATATNCSARRRLGSSAMCAKDRNDRCDYVSVTLDLAISKATSINLSKFASSQGLLKKAK